MAASGDALAVGAVASLARPGGTVTGSTFFGRELYGKRLELLKAAMPRLTHVAVLLNPDNPTYVSELNDMEGVAKSMKVSLSRFEERQPDEFDGVFTAMAQRRVDAVVITNEAVFTANSARIADVAARRRLPSAGSKQFVEAGGLIGYDHNTLELYRRAAYFVDKILKGAKPGDLPVERPTKFELVINRASRES
ncbi:MAG: ABC transporter substrate-binding protein [Candidatus Rokubacteria bacterium]|nr:ABC transporter substrate-binding protein [Candidatus Rokubacteria bacterium]